MVTAPIWQNDSKSIYMVDVLRENDYLASTNVLFALLHMKLWLHSGHNNNIIGKILSNDIH